MTTRIAVTCNDVPPGCGVPNGAQGLRAFGLFEGFRSHNLAVDIVVRDSVAYARLNRWGDEALSIPPYLRILPQRDFPVCLNEDYDYVLCPNWTSLDGFKKSSRVTLIYDFFSPTLVEQSFLRDPATVAVMRERKLEILRQADLFIANGKGRADYGRMLLHDAGLRCDSGVTSVGFALPWKAARRPAGQTLNVFLGGYDQVWISGLTVAMIERIAQEVEIEITVIGVGSHLHFKGSEEGAAARELGPRVRVRDICAFEEYSAINAGCDLMLDAFERNRERTLSYSSRAISSLCCGCPVIHPSFTEVGTMIESTRAGWVISEPSVPTLIELLARLKEGAAEVEEAKSRTRLMWERHCDPAREIEQLLAKL